MTEITVERTRGDLVESIHQVACAVVTAEGHLLARSGNPDLETWWRSAAKPFQALPLVEDGAADRFGLGTEELALSCASHSSEPEHLRVIDRFLGAIGQPESALACGPHPPLSADVQRAVARSGQVLTPRWSNCSGKHAGMLALAGHHGWPVRGYVLPDHPVQQRIHATIAEWTGLPAGRIQVGVDGCAAPCFGLPLSGMAGAWARLGTSSRPAASRLREAMLAHRFLMAGTGRPCTEIMAAWPGKVIAKIGAEGVYSATIPAAGLGVALKVVDGDMRASAIAMVTVLRELFAEVGEPASPEAAHPLAEWINAPIVNTRGHATGVQRAQGSLVFLRRSAAIG